MRVYEAPSFTQAVEGYRIRSRVDEIKRQIEEHAQSHLDLSPLLQFRVPYYKKAAGAWQVFGRCISVEGVPVFCFLGVLPFQSGDYESFKDDPEGFGAKHFEPAFDEADLDDWLASLDQSDQPKWDPLPAGLWDWLGHTWSEAFGLDASSNYVFESKAWFNSVGVEEFGHYWEQYRNLVLDAVTTDPDSGPHPDLPSPLRMATNQHGRVVVYAWVRARLPGADSRSTVALNAVFLIAPFPRQPDEAAVLSALEEASPDGRAATLLEMLSRSPLGYDEVARLSVRSYVDYIVGEGDGTAWRRVGMDETANLALSSEEHQLVSSVIRPVVGGSALPIFINGRAGSGKSTMLMYLFADICYRKIKDDLDGTPLFLTRNRRLLDREREGVQQLLRAHQMFLGADALDFDPEMIAPWFQDFDGFVLSRLQADQQDRFAPTKRVTFGSFKRALRGEPGAMPPFKGQLSGITPEIAWFIIRTFIKGYSGGEFLDPEGYSDLPRREQVVDPDQFEAVFQRIWQPWYSRLLAEGFWDDQDLVAEAIAAPSEESDITAIFCDEAQDFTRQELRYLLRLSVFSRHDLAGVPVSSLPFAFAGDPFQTLNPTGFSWRATGSTFHSELAGRLGQQHVGVRFEELTINYRSSAEIVRIINGVQLWRRTLLGIDEVKPQAAWHHATFRDDGAGEDGASAPPVAAAKFILGSNLAEDEFISNAGSTPIIVPCEDGELLDYVKDDELLREAFRNVDQENPPTNLYTTSLAKGLEFERVILYRFGDWYDGDIFDSGGSKHRFKDQFFFNKLYVGASRATDRLFVVDSQNGDSRLWAHHSVSEFGDLVDQLVGSREPFLRDDVAELQLAPAGTSSQLWETNLGTLAQTLYEASLEIGDPQLMRQARDNFRRAANDKRASRCEAWALRFEGKHAVAGNLFVELNDHDAAWDAYWEGECWPELALWFERSPDAARVRKSGHQAVVDFMAIPAARLEPSHLDVFSETLQTQIASGQVSGPTQRPWASVVDRLARGVLNRLDQFDESQLGALGSLLQDVGSRGFRSGRVVAGRCFFELGSWDRVLSSWAPIAGDLDDVDQDRLTVAQAEDVGFPDGLRLLARLGPQAVVERWRAAGSPCDTAWLDEGGVADQLTLLGMGDDAWGAVVRTNDPDAILRYFDRSIEATEDEIAGDRVVALAEVLGDRVNEIVARLDRLSVRVSRDAIAAALARLSLQKLANYTSSTQAVLPRLIRNFDNGRVLSGLGVGTIGRLLEPFGDPERAHRFYERFIESLDTVEREEAREGWLRTQRRRIQSLQGGDRRAEQAILEERRTIWGGKVGETEILSRPGMIMIANPSSGQLITVDFDQRVVRKDGRRLTPTENVVRFNDGALEFEAVFGRSQRLEVLYRGKSFRFHPE